LNSGSVQIFSKIEKSESIGDSLFEHTVKPSFGYMLVRLALLKC